MLPSAITMRSPKRPADDEEEPNVRQRVDLEVCCNFLHTLFAHLHQP